jgi:hypothetical protein
MDGVRRVGGGFVAVVATATSDCGAPNGFHIVSYAPFEGATILPGPPPSGTLRQLHVVPRPDGGIWALWQHDDGRTVGPVLGLLLDGAGAPLGEPLGLVPSGVVFDRLAATTMGDELVIAYTDAFDPSAPTVVLARFDAQGAPLSGAAHTPGAWARTADGYALLGAPDGRAVLLGWAAVGLEPEVAGTAQVYVARFDCRS